jgi:hypothetical protein
MADHPQPTAHARELVRGAFDVHIHVAPDVMRRRIDDVSLAERFAAVGMAGFVLKSHAAPGPGSRRSAPSRSTRRSAA